MGLNVGQTLQKGKYTIEKELARGCFDISYLAKRTDGERWVIKVLDSQLLSTLTRAERERLSTLFWQEAVKLSRCSNTPHIVLAEMPFSESGTVCFPVEYVQGRDLASRPQPVLPEKLALKYIGQIGDALTVVHRQKLVHRDVRPSNILLRIRNGQAEAVLTNFALAIDCDTELTRTRRSELVDGFSPIELYSGGQTVGFFTDVYSLSATLYELLTGEAPRSAEDLKRALAQGADWDTLIAPQVKNPSISEKTVKAIRDGMKLRPEKRPQTVAAWLSSLNFREKISRGSSTSTVDWTKWQAVWGAVAAIVTLIVGGIPMWLALRQPDASSNIENPSLIQNSPKDTSN